jgi:hypothetical protein
MEEMLKNCREYQLAAKSGRSRPETERKHNGWTIRGK